MSALHPSRVLRKPFMPPAVSAAEVSAALRDALNDRHEMGSGSSAADVHELTSLPTDELTQRVHRFSRTNFAPVHRPLLYAHLKEIMKPQRMAQMPIKAVQDYLHLAHVAGLHETCLEVYHAARKHMTPAMLSLHSKSLTSSTTLAPALHGGALDGTSGDRTTAPANAGGGGSSNLIVESAVLVSSFVVDSAYAVQSSSELTRMASYCVSQLLLARSPTSLLDSNAAVAVRSPQETVVGMSLVRCLWRAICLAEFYSCTEASGVNGVKGSAEQAMADALAILEGCQRVATAAAAASRMDADAAPVSRALSPHADKGRQAEELRDLLCKATRLVRYATAGDDGEFAFFHFCKETGVLVSPQPLPLSNTRGGGCGPLPPSLAEGNLGTASVPPAAVTYDPDEVQVFYGSLIETCTTGQLVPEAMLYFTEARRLLGCDPLADEGDDNAEVLMLAAAARAGVEGEQAAQRGARGEGDITPSFSPVLPTSVGTRTAPPPPPAPSSTPSATTVTTLSAPAIDSRRGTRSDIFTDFLINRLLFTLQAAKDNRRVVRLARALIAAGVAQNVKVNLWTLLLISAGAMRAVDVVLAAHRFAMQQLSVVSDGGGAESAGGSERRTWEYLLQTSVNALSKCQLPHYEQDYLLPAQENGMLHCTDEFYYGCLLEDAHRSMNPVQRAAEVLARMGDAKVPLTAPLVSRLLKLYLRAEVAEFLAVYKHAAKELHLRRVQWTDQLILWADRRRYFLTREERAYIVDEVMRSRNVREVSKLLPLLGGLRAQFALLHYDLTHDACEQFLRDGTVPNDAPTMQDSRAHFLTTRAVSVQRGVMAPAGGCGSWVCQIFTEQSHRGSDDSWFGEEVGAETERYGRQPRLLSDRTPRTLHAAIAELSEVPLLLPAGASPGAMGAASPGEAERLHDEALRVYLADVLKGLQRSLNSVS
jgi:hypothetical protein